MKNINMLTISKILGELIEEYVCLADDANRDCRLLVPGLTQKIAQQVHIYLFERNINSYLVIGPEEEPVRKIVLSVRLD